MRAVKLSALPTTGRRYCIKKLSRPQGQSAAGRIPWMKNLNGLIGNWNLDLPACSAALQPTTPPGTRFLRNLVLRPRCKDPNAPDCHVPRTLRNLMGDGDVKLPPFWQSKAGERVTLLRTIAATVSCRVHTEIRLYSTNFVFFIVRSNTNSWDVIPLHLPATTETFIIQWDKLYCSLLVTNPVLWHQPFCRNCFHSATIFKPLSVKIVLQRRNHDIHANSPDVFSQCTFL
jgi:hypothetical protein